MGAERQDLPPGSRYVSMGSSFAASPGVGVPADTSPDRCRSMDNFARQLARKRRLDLVDDSCSGGATAYILAPWSELPAQIDAVTPDTRLGLEVVGREPPAVVLGIASRGRLARRVRREDKAGGAIAT